MFLSVVRHVRPLIDDQGFTPLESSSRFRVFMKLSDELAWYVAFTKVPPARAPECTAAVDPELFVSVRELNRKLLIGLDIWTFGPVRMSLRRLPLFPAFDVKQPDVWCMNSDEEAVDAGQEVAGLLISHGFPFLERYGSAIDVVRDLRTGGQHIFRAGGKNLYDADVIEGIVDPSITPYIHPSKKLDE